MSLQKILLIFLFCMDTGTGLTLQLVSGSTLYAVLGKKIDFSLGNI